MADPTKPDIDYSYEGFQTEQQINPFPGTQLDNDLAELKRGVDDTIDALTDVRRSDGALKNGIVTRDSLGADVATVTDAMNPDVYDPNSVAGDAFDMDNMVEGATTKILTADERSKLAGVEDGATADQTGAEIKALYEAEADTNAYTDIEKAKLAGVADGATANSSDATLLDRANHTGTQAIATVSGLQSALDAKIATAETSTVGMGFVVDEDDMVSDSATKVPTQQSVKAYVDGRSIFGVSLVQTRTALKALDPSFTKAAYLTEPRRSGLFVWTLGNFSTLVTADTAEGIYLASDTVPTTTGAWVRDTPEGDWVAKWFGTPSGFTNAAPAITAAFNLFNTSGNSCQRFVVDQYYLLQAELPVIGASVAIDGINMRNGFEKDYIESHATRGILALDTRGPQLRNLSIRASSGTGGAGISHYIVGPNNQSGMQRMANLNISCGDYVTNSLYLNGAQVTVGALGYRMLMIENCGFFGSAGSTIYMNDVKYFAASNCQTHGAGGTGTHALEVHGSGSGSTEIRWDGFLDGDVFIEQCTNSRINGHVYDFGPGSGNVWFKPTATNCWVNGDIAGALTNEGTNCGRRNF